MLYRKFEKIRLRVAAIITQDNSLLLIAHKKDNNVYWLLPGGGVSYGETLTNALKREVKEELGISINVIDSISQEERRHIINLCFNCTYKGGDYIIGKEKRLHNFDYFNKKKLEKLEIFPAINNELIDILDGKGIGEIYQEKQWIPL